MRNFIILNLLFLICFFNSCTQSEDEKRNLKAQVEIYTITTKDIGVMDIDKYAHEFIEIQKKFNNIFLKNNISSEEATRLLREIIPVFSDFYNKRIKNISYIDKKSLIEEAKKIDEQVFSDLSNIYTVIHNFYQEDKTFKEAYDEYNEIFSFN